MLLVQPCNYTTPEGGLSPVGCQCVLDDQEVKHEVLKPSFLLLGFLMTFYMFIFSALFVLHYSLFSCSMYNLQSTLFIYLFTYLFIYSLTALVIMTNSQTLREHTL